jgi:hypothetical protein
VSTSDFPNRGKARRIKMLLRHEQNGRRLMPKRADLVRPGVAPPSRLVICQPRHLYRLTLAGREYVAELAAPRAGRAVPRPRNRWSEA